MSQLAHGVEGLVIMVLSHDSFIDALQDQQLQIYVKQAHPGDLQLALARAMEFEALIICLNNKE